MGIPISKRPQEVRGRKAFGHWELDSMVSSRGESKGLSTILCLSMVFVMSATAFAGGRNPCNLQSLANEYITVSSTENETIYSNIQEFYAAAHAELPSVSDIDLAKAVMERTNQDYSDMTNDVILEALDFTEITSVEEVYRTLEDGTVEVLTIEEAQAILDNPVAPMAEWESDDGYMKLISYASAGTKGDYGTPFTLSCTARWLKYPSYRLTDTLAIVYGGTFDDSYTIHSTLKETGSCSECGKAFSWDEEESYGKEKGNNTPHFITNSSMIELDFGQAQAIGAKHDIKIISCVHLLAGTPVNCASTTKMESYIRFRVLCNSTTEARAAYAHTKLTGTISISGCISSTGVSPTFSGVLSIIAAKYTASPHTLRCK